MHRIPGKNNLSGVGSEGEERDGCVTESKNARQAIKKGMQQPGTKKGIRIMKSVYVGNLPYATTDSELKALFEPFGTVISARIKTDRETGRPLGYGFVQMEDAAAAKAIQALDGQAHAGRNLRVNESREKSPSDRPPRRDGGDRSGRPPRREGGFNSDRPPRREGGFSADRPPRRDFGGGRPGFDRPANRDYNPPFQADAADDFDNDAEDVSDYGSSPHEYGNDRPQRRRTFRKNNQYGGRDNRDSDRPRRPFVKSSPRKKGYRPNEDYESEE